MKPQYPPQYRAILNRWNALCEQGKYGLDADERAEMERLGAQLDAYELAHRQQSVFEAVTNDYADLRHIGDLSGAEL